MPLNRLCFQSTLCPLTKEFLMCFQEERTVRRRNPQRSLEDISSAPLPPGRTVSKKTMVKQKTNQQHCLEKTSRSKCLRQNRTKRNKSKPRQAAAFSDELTTRPSRRAKEPGGLWNVVGQRGKPTQGQRGGSFNPGPTGETSVQ